MSDLTNTDVRLRMEQRRSPSAADPAPVQTPAADFTGASIPVQFKLPQDLAASLKLHSISNTESMSEIVLRCLTTSELVSKAWVSTRKAA